MEVVKLRYETGIATLIQFVTMTILNVGTGFVAIITGCRGGVSNCVVSAFTSVVFFMLIALWFGIVWGLGFMAQQRRSKHLAQLLICAEAMIALVALFNAKHHTDPLGLVTSLVDFALAIWVMYLAFRLIRANGARIVSNSRQRKHVGNFDFSTKQKK